jgi:hypothetical protein
MRCESSFPQRRHFNLLTLFCRWVIAANVLLFLADHYQWFNFGRHKGWITVGAVALTVASLLLLPVGLALRRKRLQFSLATTIWVTTAIALPAAWLGYDIKQAQIQRMYLQSIQSTQGSWFRYDVSPEKRRASANLLTVCLLDALGDDFFSNVAWVDIAATSDGFDRLSEVRHLYGVNLRDCKLTDETLFHLRDLSLLESICLDGTPITDHGLRHLVRLKNLDHLWLRNTQVTLEGVRKLQRELPNCRIWHSHNDSIR